MLIGIPSHWRFAPLLMGSLQTVSNHLARTSTGHLAKCADATPGNCECTESSVIRTRRDVSVVVGGTFSPQACNLCAGGPVTPASCSYSTSPLGTYTVSCGGLTRSLNPTQFGNHSFFVCNNAAARGVYYYAEVIVEYISGGLSGFDEVHVSVNSGHYVYFGFSPVTLVPTEAFRDEYDYTTRANCTSLGSATRTWVTSTGNNGCDISGITTSASVL